MKLRHMLLGTAMVLGSAGAAEAAYVTQNGWYVSLGAGVNWVQDMDVAFGPPTTPGTSTGQIELDSGYIVSGAIGYDWGRWRAEFEVAYRDNDVDCIRTSGTPLCTFVPLGVTAVWELSQMVNVLYDFNLGGNWSASLGAGVGGNLVVAEGGIGVAPPEPDDYVLAAQLIAQLAYQLSDRWQLYADYHFMFMDDPEMSVGGVFFPGFQLDMEKTDHALQIGLRFDLQREGAAPPPAPPGSPRQFIVFFGFNKSHLTPEAARVVADAAQAAKDYGSAQLIVVGHTDTVGSPEYNLRLSLRRADAVKGGLMQNGIPADAISTGGRGEDELMVQTGDGVKEPQNRRATIDLN